MNMWRAEDSKPIEVSDILPWVEELTPKTRGRKRLATSQQDTRKPESPFEHAVRNYALNAGVDIEDLTPEERAELEVNAVNLTVAADLDAPGFRMFGRKYYGKFPD